MVWRAVTMQGDSLHRQAQTAAENRRIKRNP
jgi:hypothetical protein